MTDKDRDRGNTMKAEKQEIDDHGGGGSDGSQSSGSRWAFGTFLPGPSGRTATTMSEGGGTAYKQTNGPYLGRSIGGGTRVSLLAHVVSNLCTDTRVW